MKQIRVNLIRRDCVICGKSFPIRVYNDGTYSGGEYLGTFKIGIGDWTASRYENSEFKRCIPLWKHIYFTLRDYKRTLLRQYEKIEIWKCDECIKDEEKDG